MTEPIKNSVNRNKNLAGCGVPPSPMTESLNKDEPPSSCSPTSCPPSGDELCGGKYADTQKRVAGEAASWLQDIPANQHTGHGQGANCDPMQKGHIVNQTGSTQTLYRYNRALRGADEAMLDLFNDIVILDLNGKAWPAPIMWATQERAVQIILGDNVRKDNSLVVDRINLPIMAISQTDIQYQANRYTYHMAKNYFRYLRSDGKPGFTASEKHDRDTVFGVSKGLPVDISYTLHAWCLYEEDMNQIAEQVFAKLIPAAYISVRGVQWKEIMVKLDSTSNNTEAEPGDMAERVIKYAWNMTVESYIPQPITRTKAVLSMKRAYEVLTPDEVPTDIERHEQAVEDFE